MKTYRGQALDGGEWLVSSPSHFASDTHWMRGWVDPEVSMDAMTKREYPFSAPAGNRTPLVQPVA